jgi:hypothetical protein
VESLSGKDESVVRYLLGELSEEEGARLEDEYFADDEAFEQLLAAEDELFDAYARGELSADRSARFERRVLHTRRGRERASFARELRRAVAEHRAPEAAARADAARGVSPRRPLFASLLPRTHAARFALASLVVLLMLGGAWLLYERGSRRAQLEEAQRQATNDRATTPPATSPTATPDAPPITPEQSPPEERARAGVPRAVENAPTQRPRPSVVSLVLSPNLARGANPSARPSRLVIPRDATSVKLLLKLAAEGDYRSYNASLETVEGRGVWRLVGIGARRGSRAVILSVPASRLSEGGYIIKLEGVGASHAAEEIADYYFSVKKD